jgi:hypothetical protein
MLEKFFYHYNNERYQKSSEIKFSKDVYLRRSEENFGKKRQLNSDSIRKRRQLCLNKKLLILNLNTP